MEKKNVFCLLFVAFLIINGTYATVYTGTCGTELSWSLDSEEGVLIVTGSGEMIGSTYCLPPINEYVKSVQLPAGLTALGTGALGNCRNLESVTIPDGVTSIGERAFFFCDKLEDIPLPAGLTYIGKGAFQDCTHLKKMTIPSGISTIEQGAFYGCSRMKTIEIPASVTAIGEQAFSGNSALQAITCLAATPPTITENTFEYVPDTVLLTVPDDSYYAYKNNSYWGRFRMKDAPYIIYSGVCGENVTWTLDSRTKVLTISGTGEMYHDNRYDDPEHWKGQHLENAFNSAVIEPGVTSVGYWAFANSTNLKTISLPDGITVIEAYAFYNSGLTSIVLPNSVTEVQESAFSDCKQLASCDLGRGIKHIGKNCFWDCTALKSLKWSDCLETIGSGCFISWGSGSSDVGKIPLQDTLVFPATFRSMDEIFSCYTNVKVVIWNARRPEGSGMGPLYNYYHSYDKIIVGDEVEIIPNNLFRDQTKIDTIILPESVESIGQNAFNGCKKLQYVNIPENVQSIGKAAFYNCAALTSLELPEGISEIYGSTFYGCKNLTRINIPEGVTAIDESAFNGCTALDSIVLPQSLRTISESAFANMSTPKELVIPDKVITVSGHAFENWTNLEKLTVGKEVMLFGDQAFAGNTAIKEIQTLCATPPVISAGTFTGVPDSAWLSVIPGTESLYRNDANWSRFRMMNLPDTMYVPTKVTVEAEITTAMFTWPTDAKATTYQIDIYKNGTKFCSLTLDSYGRLLGIAFSRKRSAARQDEEKDIPYALSFMVTGLDAASRYNYVLSALDVNGTPVHVYIGDFATQGYTGELKGGGDEVLPTPPIIPSDPEYVPTGMEESDSPPTGGIQKVIRNGQLLFIFPDGIYDISGKRIE